MLYTMTSDPILRIPFLYDILLFSAWITAIMTENVGDAFCPPMEILVQLNFSFSLNFLFYPWMLYGTEFIVYWLHVQIYYMQGFANVKHCIFAPPER